MAKVPADKLHDEIMKILGEYVDDVDRKSDACVRKVAQKGRLALRKASPKQEGEYAKGWSYRVTRKRLDTTAVIYNGAKPGLPHLLEYGHATRNGTGRTYPPTPAHPHIAPIEEQIDKEFNRSIVAELS